MRKCNLNQAPCHETCDNFAVFDSRRSPAHRCSRCAFSISLVPLQPCRATRRVIITSSSSHRPPLSFSFPIPSLHSAPAPSFCPLIRGYTCAHKQRVTLRCSLFAEVARVTRVHSHTPSARIKHIYVYIYIYIYIYM